MPLWLAYDHWTALATAENVVARQMALRSDPTLVPGTQAFLDKARRDYGGAVAGFAAAGARLVNAPHLFGMEIGFNLPAFLIALVITAILVIGIKESASFNATIVVIKVTVVLFVMALGHALCEPAQLGHGLALVCADGLQRALGRGPRTSFSRTSDLMRCRRRRKKPKIRSGICRSALSFRWPICTLSVYRRRRCADGHGAVAGHQY